MAPARRPGLSGREVWAWRRTWHRRLGGGLHPPLAAEDHGSDGQSGIGGCRPLRGETNRLGDALDDGVEILGGVERGADDDELVPASRATVSTSRAADSRRSASRRRSLSLVSCPQRSLICLKPSTSQKRTATCGRRGRAGRSRVLGDRRGGSVRQAGQRVSHREVAQVRVCVCASRGGLRPGGPGRRVLLLAATQLPASCPRRRPRRLANRQRRSSRPRRTGRWRVVHQLDGLAVERVVRVVIASNRLRLARCRVLMRCYLVCLNFVCF